MITVIATLATFIFGWILVNAATEFYNNKIAKWKNICMIFSCSILGFGILVNTFTNEIYELKIWSVPLESLKDNTFISGHISMVLGSGSGEVKQEFEYTMYLKTSNGAKLIRLPLDKCKIVYSNKPEIETIMKVYKEPNDWKRFFYIKQSDEVVQYNLKVPRSSIDGVFKLDAQ